MSTTTTPSATWSLPSEYTYTEWDGSPLPGSFLAFDCETEIVDLQTTIPRPVLFSASSPEGVHVYFRPQALARCIQTHKDRHWVGHNAGHFDFWVADKSLRDQDQGGALYDWWTIADEGRLHDSLLMDQLVRLARGTGDKPYGAGEDKLLMRGLDKVATEYGARCIPDKENPYRMRFAELWNEPDWTAEHVRPYLDYAVGDTIATAELWPSLYAEALRLSPRGENPPYGVLTETIQVKAAIALAQVTRNGLGFDYERATAYAAQVRTKAMALVTQLESQYPGLFKHYVKKNAGGHKTTAKSHLPQLDYKIMRGILTQVAQELDIKAPKSKGKTPGLVSAAYDDWSDHLNKHPFLRAWSQYNEANKLLGFFAHFDKAHAAGHDRLHPRYHTLVRTGRTSSSGPNAQQFPRDADFRALFVPTRGFKLLASDYQFVELRTLAAVCEHRYNWSKLADTIRVGIDPHEQTAAMLRGVPVQEFQALKITDPNAYKTDRQSSKSLNFGVPGGLGGPKLAAYAKATYGVFMDEEQARELRSRLVNEVYPELALYLADSSVDDLAGNLKCTPESVHGKASDVAGKDKVGMVLYCLRRVFEGKPQKANGEPYNARWVEQMWNLLKALLDLSSRRDAPFLEWKRDAQLHKANPTAARSLFSTASQTLTGRIRSGCTYTQGRNAPFQGLAADGIKLAMWELTKRGFKIVASIHDELLVELPTPTADADAKVVTGVMVSEMEKVLGGKVPVATSMRLNDFWEKD